MPLSEFELIERFFRGCGAARADVALGVGDDAALLECPPEAQLVAALDTLVEGVHFPAGCAPASIGHRALAVNLSDLAAMGAAPAWALLALTLPRVQESWLRDFSTALGALARQHEVALVGGDTTCGPLSTSVQVLGFVPRGQALTRSGGHAGDVLFVSGTPGDAAAGLLLEQQRLYAADAAHGRWLRERFLYPAPRVQLGQRLRGIASACIDVSDGLLGDCGKLAAASSCGAQLEHAQLPLSAALSAVCGQERARALALTGGDDYELCFSVPAHRLDELLRQLPPQTWGYHRIGRLREEPGSVVLQDGNVMQFSPAGFDHFS